MTNLMLLFGDIDYDGRAKRMLSVSRTLDSSIVVDASEKEALFPNKKHIRVSFHAKQGTISRHIAFFVNSVLAAIKCRPSVVFAENYHAALPGLVAARIVGARLVYDAYELILPEPGKRQGFRDRFWYYLERLAVRFSNLTVAANEDRAAAMKAHYGLSVPITFMQNIPSLPSIDADKHLEVSKSFPEIAKKAIDEISIIYQGDMSLSRGLDRFIAAFAHLPKNYRLILVGDGPDLNRLRELASAIDEGDRIKFLGRVPHSTLPSITEVADIGIVTYPFSGQNNILCAPNKIFEYVHAGLKVISSDQPPLRRIVRECNLGLTYDENDGSSEIAAKIISLKGKLAREDRDMLINRYNSDIEGERIKNAISSIL